MRTNELLASVRPGLIIAGAVVVFGICLGITFGLFEDDIKSLIKAGIAANPAPHAEDSQAAQKIWRWWLRGHFHSMGLGALTMALIALTALSGLKPPVKRYASVLIGLGGCYGLSWFVMANKAVAVGRSAAHHAPLVKFIVFVSVGCLLLGIGILFANIIFGLFGERRSA